MSFKNAARSLISIFQRFFSILVFRLGSSTLLKGLLLTFTAFIISLLFSLFELSEKLELISLDYRYRLRPLIEKSDQIVLVNFDDPSLAQYGEWPWSRRYQSILVDTLHFYRAGYVGFDVFFSERELPVLVAKDDNLSQLKKEGIKKASKAMNPSRQPSYVIRDYDEEFAKAVLGAGTVYLSYSSRDPFIIRARQDIAAETEKVRSRLTGEKMQAVTLMESALPKVDPTVEPFLYKSVDIEPPLISLLESARGFGFAQPGYNRDSTNRSFILFRYYNGHLLYPITLVMLSDIMGFDLKDTEIAPESHVVFKRNGSKGTGNIEVPVDKNLQALLNWPGPFEESFTHISFRDIAALYAHNRAKEMVISMGKELKKDLSGTIKVMTQLLIEEHLLSDSEIRSIVEDIAAAAIVEDFLRRDIARSTILKRLYGIINEKRAEDIFFQVETALRAELFLHSNPEAKTSDFITSFNPEGMRLREAEEIFKTLREFYNQKRLHELKPYLLPPSIKVRDNGNIKRISPFAIKDKIILIGLTGKNTIDLNPTPFEKDCPMVFYHASGINMMLTENFLHYPPAYVKYIVAFTMALFVGIIAVYRSVTSMTIFASITGMGYLFAVYQFWVYHGQWVEVVVPATAMVSAYILSLIVQLVKVYGEKAKIRGIFSSMVSPAVLSVMEQNPERFTLTGERRQATTYFSKIDGLSSLINSFSPEDAPQFLSAYLTPLSDMIMEYGGYIDKYEGAVIMADFGVPIEDRGNHYKCAFSSLEQRFFIEAFKYCLMRRYSIRALVSIGFNTGYVSAGNMGSERKFQYTVMGDPVNTAARFMAANSIYQSAYPITGEETMGLLKDYVYARPLDKLLLKGKTKPIKVYDILGWKAEAYRGIMRGRPLPSFLMSLWAKSPSECLLHYAQYWSAQQERLDHPLADRFASFFSEQAENLPSLLNLELVLELLKTHSEIVLLCDLFKNNLNLKSGEVSLTADVEDTLHSWDEVMRALILLIREREGDKSLMQRADALINKIELLGSRCRGNLESDEGLRKEIRCLIDAPSDNLINRTETLIDKHRTGYEAAISKLIKGMKAEDYYDLMSRAGEPERKDIIPLFEKGLELYWQRRWDDAIEVFQRSSLLDQTDRTAPLMIERLESYKVSPPRDDWQGEYIQTKK